jgi:hypothetical protein
VQWSIDNGNLSPWAFIPGMGIWKSTARDATVLVGRSLSFEQDGSMLACGTTDTPREFDLFFSPNQFPQIPLDTAQQITLDIDATYEVGIGRATAPCPTSMSNMTVGLSLSNADTHQTLFYQLHLRGQALTDGKLVPGEWPNEVTWFSKSNPFEADEFLPGGAATPPSSRVSEHLDLLTRLKTAILTATVDIPKRQWMLVGLFAGQAIWGNCTTKTMWHDIELWRA